LWLDGKTWYGRWREDVLVGGVRKRIRREEAIGSLKDYPTKRLAQRALDDRIAHVNKVSYRPRSTAKFRDFAQNWKEKVLSQFRIRRRSTTGLTFGSTLFRFLVSTR